MAVPVLGIASPAGAASNSDNAKACQQGGFVNQATSSGARFKNAGECTSYAAKGGILVPLPDLVPDATCTIPSPNTVSCLFRVHNSGAAPASNIDTRVLDLLEGHTPIAIAFAFAGPVGPGETSSQTLHVQITNPDNTARALTLTFVIDPNNSITEGNETNNTFSQSFTLAPAP